MFGIIVAIKATDDPFSVRKVQDGSDDLFSLENGSDVASDFDVRCSAYTILWSELIAFEDAICFVRVSKNAIGVCV